MEKYLMYIGIINFLTFLFYGLDKFLAKKGKNRISERFLFFLSFIGGAFGAFIGMFFFRHKTRKVKFFIWNILWILIWGYLTIKFWR